MLRICNIFTGEDMALSKTQKKILEAAYDVLAQDFSAPLDRIATAAGVTRMTLHRNFKSREVLLEAAGLELVYEGNRIIDRALDGYQAPLEQLQSIVMQATSMGDRFHFMLHAVEEMDFEAIGSQLQQMDDRMLALFDALREQGFIKKDVPNAWLLHHYGGVMTAAWTALRDGAVARRDIPRLAWQSFAYGLIEQDPS